MARPTRIEDRERFMRRARDPDVDALRHDRPPSSQPPTPGGDWREGVMTASGLNVLAGIWLIIAPFVLGYRDGDPVWNDIVFGAIVVVLAAIRLTGARRQAWLSIVNCAIGVWIFIAAFALDASGVAAANDIILGVIIFVLGALSATATQEGLAAGAAGTPRRWYRR